MSVISNLFRFFYLGVVLIFSGLFFRLVAIYIFPRWRRYLKKNLGKKISKVAEFLGPSYIKLGQFLSTRPDLIGFEMSDQLAKLQDKLKPFDFKSVKREVENAFKAELHDVFMEFSEEASAAASIAQVHKARLKNGKEVAVKILRPGVERTIASDIRLFYMMSKIFQFFSSHARRMRLYKVVGRLEKMVKNELDLRMEAAAADVLRKNLIAENDVIIPEIYWEYTTQRIMVSAWCHGVPANDLDAIKKMNVKPDLIAQKLAVTLFNQAFRDGFFHADLHPGNILVTNDGKIVLLDFGIMGSLDHKSRLFIADMLHGFITRDYDKVSRLHFDIGYVPKDQSIQEFALACRSIGEPIVGKPVNQISVASLMKQLFEISEKFNISLQPQLILLQKTLVVVEGVGYSLYPDVNMWKLAEPWIIDWGKRNLSPTAKFKRAAGKYSEILCDLPDAISRLESIIDDFAAKLKKKSD